VHFTRKFCKLGPCRSRRVLFCDGRWQIYEDSIVLQSVVTNARERLEKGGSSAVTTPHESDEETGTVCDDDDDDEASSSRMADDDID